jgi:hypothetical protein
LHQCKVSKRKVVVLKLDFENAFDTIEHDIIFKILQHNGFSPQWINSVKSLLTSVSSSILLNGVPGKQFVCKRGVRQGDPLSPLLFVLGGDLLQSAINSLLDRGELQLPIPTGVSEFPIVQYADDTLLILPTDSAQLASLKNLLVKFTATTGLAVNYHKSCMLPINVPDDEIQLLAMGFGCTVGSFPFTYLGLPMGTTRPGIQDLSPLVCRIERKLTASMNLLAYRGRLQLIQSCIQFMPIFFLCSLHIPPGILKPINRIIRHGLWGKNEDGKGKQSLASREMICKPRSAGGLGIMDFGKQNDALLIKQLHKFYNKAEVPWVQLVWNYYTDVVPHVAKLCGSFWWKDVMKLAGNYREFCHVTPVAGDSILFWSDKWRGNSLSHDFPR